MKKPSIYLMFAISLTLFSSSLLCAENDQWRISFGGQLQASSWTGNDSSASSDYSSSASQLALNIRFQKNQLFAGINFSGGTFEFLGTSPDQHKQASKTVVSDAKIKRNESDLLVGYYFWPRVALFLDIKNITSAWEEGDYSIHYSGLGIGINAFHPINQQWIVYGSFGVMPISAKVKKQEVGDGAGSALSVGALYRFDDKTSFTIGIKNQSQTIEFKSTEKQTHNIGGLVLGVTRQL